MKANFGNLDHPQFYWWLGVVEDRIDSYELGRYKVRIMGYHSANKETLKTEDLPWATPLNSVTSAGVSGIMETPSILPGSTVIGFFADGENGQTPIILGTIAGHPVEVPTDGFSDPAGVYPKSGIEGENDLNEPDLPRLSRGKKAEEHFSLLNKREQREEKIKTARAPSFQEEKIADDKPNTDYETKFWDEPHPRGAETLKYFDPQTDEELQKGPEFEETTSVYPYNKVKETESGHVFEVDDTPFNGRISEYHNEGTFREIQKDGTKVQKIVGSDYEIVVKDKNALIRGNVNVTIGGDCKLLVQGNKYEEIEGDHYVTILGDRLTKINGNDIKAVATDETTQINANRWVRVSEDDKLNVEGRQDITVLKNRTLLVKGGQATTVEGNFVVTAKKNYGNRVTGIYKLTTGDKLEMAAQGTSLFASLGDMKIKTDASMVNLAAANMDIDANNMTIDAPTMSIDGPAGNITSNNVTLHTHTHPTTSMDTGDGTNSGATNNSDSPNSGT